MLAPPRGTQSRLQVIACAAVPTQFGTFDMHVFRWASDVGESDVDAVDHGLSPDHMALTMGELAGGEDVLLRVHSECLTSEVFGSLKCDCKEQLVAAQQAIAKVGRGAVIYLRQEGRGIGLANKIRAYELQGHGADTVDANRLLGLPDDAREYDSAAAMIRHLGIASVRLMTNNPAKVDGLRELGVAVSSRQPVLVSTNPLSAGYLETKRQRMGHALPNQLQSGGLSGLHGDSGQPNVLRAGDAE